METPRFRANVSADVYTLKTDEITVEIKLSEFGVKFLDKNGNVINEDYVNQGKTSGYENGKPYVFKKTDKDEDFYGFGEQAGLEVNKRGESMGMWNTDAYSYTKDTKYLYTTIPFFVGLKDKKHMVFSLTILIVLTMKWPVNPMIITISMRMAVN